MQQSDAILEKELCLLQLKGQRAEEGRGDAVVTNHEFCIMENNPLVSERFDTYEPKKYNCISIDDDFIEPIMVDLEGVDCYWHTLKTADKSLAY